MVFLTPVTIGQKAYFQTYLLLVGHCVCILPDLATAAPPPSPVLQRPRALLLAHQHSWARQLLLSVSRAGPPPAVIHRGAAASTAAVGGSCAAAPTLGDRKFPRGTGSQSGPCHSVGQQP